MTEERILKPNFKAFVLYNWVMTTLVLLIPTVILIFMDYTSPIVWMGLFILLSGFSFINQKIRFDKEKYIIKDDHIIYEFGHIFYDSKRKLNAANVTHVTMIHPFIENNIFKTGNVHIEAAGSAGVEVSFNSIDNSCELYEFMKEFLDKNGFTISEMEKIQEERPHMLGIIFEIVKKLLIGALIVFSEASKHKDVDLNISLFIIPTIIITLIWVVLNYQDLIRRRYRIFKDLITYEEGFLTKHYAFIPIENIADSQVSQSFFEKLFDLYDVLISCQGAGSEIKFKNMVNGKKMEENIDELVREERKIKIKEVKKEEIEDVEKKEMEYVYKDKLIRDNKYTATFKMNLLRTIFPYFFIFFVIALMIPFTFHNKDLLKGVLSLAGISLIPFILFFIVNLIKVSCTNYKVNSNSFEERFKFLSTKNTSFSTDKVTGITLMRNFIDSFLGTCSIRIWSIGSSKPLVFRNIKEKDIDFDMILKKNAINEKEEILTINSNFSLFKWVIAYIPVWIPVIAALLLVNGLLILEGSINLLYILLPQLVLLGLIYLYQKKYYAFSKITLFKDHIYFQKGFLFKAFYYVTYTDVKDINTMKYPFIECGSIKFDVTGEHIVQQGKNRAIISNYFRIKYIDDISDQDEIIDNVVLKRPSKEELQTLIKERSIYKTHYKYSTKPALINSVIGYIIFSIIITVVSILGLAGTVANEPAFNASDAYIIGSIEAILIVLFFFYIVWSVKVKEYIIEDYRVIYKSGIIYKEQFSIIFERIDYIKSDRGFLNKIFNNGNVSVNTTGSSKSELVIRNIPDFEEFYKRLEEKYK